MAASCPGSDEAVTVYRTAYPDFRNCSTACPCMLSGTLHLHLGQLGTGLFMLPSGVLPFTYFLHEISNTARCSQSHAEQPHICIVQDLDEALSWFLSCRLLCSLNWASPSRRAGCPQAAMAQHLPLPLSNPSGCSPALWDCVYNPLTDGCEPH